MADSIDRVTKAAADAGLDVEIRRARMTRVFAADLHAKVKAAQAVVAKLAA